MKKVMGKVLATLILFVHLDARAVEFEKLGNAVAKALGTKKAFQKTVNLNGKETTVFYAKSDAGEPTKLAVVQKGLWEPNCTHTWVVGMDAHKGTVDQIRVVEMSCPHAFPTNKPTFLDQYRGKGPADLKKLKGDIQTIAKATGTCNLTTDAVVSAVQAAGQFRSIASKN